MLLSWVLAKNKQTIVFAVDNRSRIIQNIKHNNKAVINVIVEESSYSISGDAIHSRRKNEWNPITFSAYQAKYKRG